MIQDTPQKLTIYRSSAGSGKTYTLVKEYLRLVLPSPYLYRNILAVTFTNKATEEMKVRILGKLDDLAHANPESLKKIGEYQDIKEELSRHRPDPDSWVPQTAGKILRSILGDYGHFSVSTIESFFQGILRVFAKELDIPIGYDIEMNQGLVLERLIQSLAVDIPEEEELQKLLKEYLHQRLRDQKGWNVLYELGNLGNELFKEGFVDEVKESVDGTEDILETARRIARKNSDRRHQFLGRLRELAKEGEKVLQDSPYSYADFKQGERASPPTFFRKILNNGDDIAPNSYSRKAAESADEWVSKKSTLLPHIRDFAQEKLQPILQEAIDYYDDHLPDYQVDQMFGRTGATFGLLGYLEKLLKEYRKEHRFLMISDTSRLLTEVIRESDPPFVYEKAGHYYQHFLLDEFQDTSRLQWENFLPLVTESLAYGKFNLLVGDIKQAIYRWRNGDPQLMAIIEQSSPDLIEKRVLEANWRSAVEVVTFNNCFFVAASKLLAEKLEREVASEDGREMTAFIQEAYKDVEQLPRREELPGFVEVVFGKEKQKDAAEQEAFEAMVSWVRRCRESGFDYQDIAILVRSNDQGIKAARALMGEEIPVSSAESLLLSSHPVVRWLLASLRLMQSPNDPLLIVTWTDLDLLISGAHSGDFLSLKTSECRLHAYMDDLRGKPLYETVESLLQLLPQDCHQQNAYVYGFLEAIWEYSAKKDTSISGFLEWWNVNGIKRSVQGAETENSVVIMTIHQSKGLEFPVVILPFVNWELGFKSGQGNIVWLPTKETVYAEDFPILPAYLSPKMKDTVFASRYEKELVLTHLDNINMLYVALTRAQSRLYLHAPKASKSADLQTPSHVGHVLEAVCKNGDIPNLKEEEELSFQLGMDKPVDRQIMSDEIKEATHISLEDVRLPQQRSEPLVNLRKREYLETTEEGKESILEGILLHDALAEINTPADISSSVKKLTLNGSLKKEEVEVFTQQLTAIIDHPEAKDWFSEAWDIRTEIGILLPDGRERRPDRVMVRGQEAVVVDYKTGSMSSSHKRQIEEYKQLMKALRYTEVKGYLYYTGNMQVVEV